MDIHKPKPIRNWREFLKEYAIVVLGVATALAAEQGVEWLHWQSQVRAARAVIATEISSNLVGAITMVRTAECVERRLDQLALVLDAASQTGRLPPLGNIGMPWRQIYPTGAWDSVVASQTATHFPRLQLAELSASYKIAQRLEDQGALELEAWNSLYTMVGPGRRLDPSSEAKLRDALSQARASSRIKQSLGSQLMERVLNQQLYFGQDDLKAITNAERQPSTMKIALCLPTGAPPASYGQAYVPPRTAQVRAMAKNLPDFSKGAP